MSDKFDRNETEHFSTGEWGQPDEDTDLDEITARRQTLEAIEQHMRRIRQAIRKNDCFLLDALRRNGIIPGGGLQ